MMQSESKAKIGRPSKGEDALTVAERSRAYRKRKADSTIDVHSALADDREVLLKFLVDLIVIGESEQGMSQAIANALQDNPRAVLLTRHITVSSKLKPAQRKAITDQLDRISKK